MKSYYEALKIINKSNLKISDEDVKVHKSLSRVCSKNIYSKYNYPAENSTSLDGFAINSKETKNIIKRKFKKFKVVGSIYAGSKNLKIKIKKQKY